VKAMRSPIVRSLAIFLSSLILNFGAFLISYRIVAFPYISEEQRVANADTVLTLCLAIFVLSALLVGGLAHWLFVKEYGKRA
jgi:hypothetical protein